VGFRGNSLILRQSEQDIQNCFSPACQIDNLQNFSMQFKNLLAFLENIG